MVTHGQSCTNDISTFHEACVRSAWAALVLFGVVLVLVFFAVPGLPWRVPSVLRTFVTLEEAEALSPRRTILCSAARSSSSLTLGSVAFNYTEPFFLKRILDAIDLTTLTPASRSQAYIYAFLAFRVYPEGWLAARDKRMGVLSELVGAVKLVNFFVWEER